MNRNVLVFGATGAIGGAIVDHFLSQDRRVYAVSRNQHGIATDSTSLEWIGWDVIGERGNDLPSTLPKVGAVVWAQGANCSDDIYDFNVKRHQEVYEANVLYILQSLQHLILKDCLAPNARLCVISSIWQNIARQKKLSYCITKSALQGLVQSLAIDLGKAGHLINAVLPGALDTPMTRANLTSQQISALEAMTPLGTLPALDDVCGLVAFLCSQQNTGITGQFVAADRGFSNARIL